MTEDDETTSVLSGNLDSIKETLMRDGYSKPALVALTGYDTGRIHVLNNYETLIGRADECEIQIFEPAISRRHAKFMVSSEGVEVFDLRSRNGLLVNGERIQRAWLDERDEINLGGVLSYKFFTASEADLLSQERLFQDAVHDPLTGVYNKRYFLGSMAQRLLVSGNRLENLSLFMLDMDHFKQVNDTYGHPAGDLALRQVSQLIASESRNQDLIGRYGGEEFIMLVSGVTLEGAVRIADRIRNMVSDIPLVVDDTRIQMTLSVGVASAKEVNGDQKRLIDLADKRLYLAKQSGRNLVCTPENEGSFSQDV